MKQTDGQTEGQHHSLQGGSYSGVATIMHVTHVCTNFFFTKAPKNDLL